MTPQNAPCSIFLESLEHFPIGHQTRKGGPFRTFRQKTAVIRPPVVSHVSSVSGKSKLSNLQQKTAAPLLELLQINSIFLYSFVLVEISGICLHILRQREKAVINDRKHGNSWPEG